jgi:hypothetical protein
MTAEQQAILTFLQQNASGSSNAIIADNIFLRITQQGLPLFEGRTQEQVRGLIRDLVNNQSSLIGSGNRGYFAITSKDDVLSTIHNLESRSTKINERRQSLIDAWNNQNPNNPI